MKQTNLEKKKQSHDDKTVSQSQTKMLSTDLVSDYPVDSFQPKGEKERKREKENKESRKKKEKEKKD